MTYIDGRRCGARKEFYETGELKEEVNYFCSDESSFSWKDGTWLYYHISGKLSLKGDFDEGDEDGIWESYYENGKVKPV
ncbi:MAG: hypothetical protein HRT57_08570 [Crocinitomicaceae bacterium]|nr:hypothetical protein [Crocinitomicaceae bacterium]